MAKAPVAVKAAKKTKKVAIGTSDKAPAKKVSPKTLKADGGKKKITKSAAAPRAVHAEIVDAQPQVLLARNVGAVRDISPAAGSTTGSTTRSTTGSAAGTSSASTRGSKKDSSSEALGGVKKTSSSDPLSEDFDPSSYESHLELGPTDEELEELDQTVSTDDNLLELLLPNLDSDLTPKKKSPLLQGHVDSNSKAISTTVSSTDPVATYLQEIRKYGLLTREQEHELAVRYREHGDSKAAELLVTSNLRFVVKVAAEYSRFGAKLIDLIQEGNVGLMHAVREYNPYKGVKLITYAVWWIRGYIQEYLMRQYSMVRIGTTQNQRKLFYRLQKEKNLLESMGRDTNYALLSSRLGVSEDEVETMTKRLSGRDVSLSQPLDNGDSTATLLDFEESLEPNAERLIGDAEELTVLKENLSLLRPRLNEKETYLLDERVLADDPLTLQEIGEHFGVTREAVRQLEVRLIGKIRAAVTESLDRPTPDDEDSKEKNRL